MDATVCDRGEPMSSGYTFTLANWQRDAVDIRQVRDQVLVTELGQSREALEENDAPQVFHVLVYDSGGRAVGAARMQRDGRVDYVAVLRPWRGRTVGGALISYLHHIAYAQRIDHLWSIVPDSATRFFERNRFSPSVEAMPQGTRKYVRVVMRPGTSTAAAVH